MKAALGQLENGEFIFTIPFREVNKNSFQFSSFDFIYSASSLSARQEEIEALFSYMIFLMDIKISEFISI